MGDCKFEYEHAYFATISVVVHIHRFVENLLVPGSTFENI